MIYVVVMSFCVGVAYVLKKRETRKYQRFLEEDAPEPAFEMPSMKQLRSSPHVLESLRGKVVSIGYNPCVETHEQGHWQVSVEESFLVDINGAVQTLERCLNSDTSTEVEENARWLANALGVEFIS